MCPVLVALVWQRWPGGRAGHCGLGLVILTGRAWPGGVGLETALTIEALAM